MSPEDPLEVALALGAVFFALILVALWFARQGPQQAPDAPAPPSSPPLAEAPAADPPSTVFDAAVDGDVEALTALLDQLPERVGLRDPSGWTPLHHAAYRDRAEATQLLLARGADPNAVAEGECAPIHMAAAEASVPVIEALAQAGADLNVPDDTGITALHYATLAGRLQVIDALLARGASPNMKDAKQETPLDIARRSADPAVADRIEQAGGRPGDQVRMAEVLAGLPQGLARQQVPRTWHLDVDSPELVGAVAQARAAMPRFLMHLADHPDAVAAVKFPLRGEGIVEYVWGEITEIGSPLRVVLSTPPVAVPSPEGPVDVGYDEVVDWQLQLDAERTAGGYSQRATFEAIRAEYGFLPSDIEAELAVLVDL